MTWCMSTNILCMHGNNIQLPNFVLQYDIDHITRFLESAQFQEYVAFVNLTIFFHWRITGHCFHFEVTGNNPFKRWFTIGYYSS